MRVGLITLGTLLVIVGGVMGGHSVAKTHGARRGHEARGAPGTSTADSADYPTSRTFTIAMCGVAVGTLLVGVALAW